MELPAAFRPFPKLKIIQGPTPIQELPSVGDWLGISNLFVKREDLTDSAYGGNKVRNLEFILGDALAKGAEQIVTVAPRGSNFVAALAAQTRKIGLPTYVFNFVPARSELIDRQADFCVRQETHFKMVAGGHYAAPVKATVLGHLKSFSDKKSYLIAPGGSSPLGVLGHIASAFELKQQILNGELEEPDVLVVGAGTCGTMAGLVAGLKLCGLKTRVVGLRCVDRIICNRLRVAQLANSALKLMNSKLRLSLSDIDLRDNGVIQYGSPLQNAGALMSQMRNLSGIHLDTTYTSKVMAYMQMRAAAGACARKKVLYWNTFSPAALL